MRSSRSPAERASNSALRAVESTREAASVEPFDDVCEPGMPGHADNTRHGATGVHGMNGAGGTGGASGAADVNTTHDAQHNTTHDTGRNVKHHTAHSATHNAQHATIHDATDDIPHEPLSPDDPLAPLPFNPYKGNRGLTRAWHAMKNSLAGFRVAIREESAFRQELTLAAILIPCGLVVPVDPVSRVLLLGSVLLVLIVELLNSSVEAAIDRISLERHELSRRAKDLGSAAVMVALGMCLMTWIVIVGPLVVGWLRAWL
ncbi:diacylglycerol kinase [Paraburkholderia susongensis]|uniref:Diacylglycerol kinase n=1 Tax=Paraburkholderia susongensis TaxID=1515439 RepID=A0A1X7L196_9BURK|nr:diacylglycerol kinase [Paraburkholderia susongensis]SMG46889.1 diacylglycerol kinase (ATP) [Paraburkholderia susongensis]